MEVTSWLSIAHWDAVVGDPARACTILDRLIHNAQRIEFPRGTACGAQLHP